MAKKYIIILILISYFGCNLNKKKYNKQEYLNRIAVYLMKHSSNNDSLKVALNMTNIMMRKYPDDQNLVLNKLQILCLQGKYKKCVRLIKKQLKNSSEYQFKAFWLYLAGNYYHKLGKYELGNTYFRKSQQLYESNRFTEETVLLYLEVLLHLYDKNIVYNMIHKNVPDSLQQSEHFKTAVMTVDYFHKDDKDTLSCPF